MLRLTVYHVSNAKMIHVAMTETTLAASSYFALKPVLLPSSLQASSMEFTFTLESASNVGGSADGPKRKARGKTVKVEEL